MQRKTKGLRHPPAYTNRKKRVLCRRLGGEDGRDDWSNAGSRRTAARQLHSSACCMLNAAVCWASLVSVCVFLRACGQCGDHFTSGRERVITLGIFDRNLHTCKQQHVHFEQHVISHPCGSRTYRIRCADECLILFCCNQNNTCHIYNVVNISIGTRQQAMYLEHMHIHALFTCAMRNIQVRPHHSEAMEPALCLWCSSFHVPAACVFVVRIPTKTMWPNDCGRCFYGECWRTECPSTQMRGSIRGAGAFTRRYGGWVNNFVCGWETGRDTRRYLLRGKNFCSRLAMPWNKYIQIFMTSYSTCEMPNLFSTNRQACIAKSSNYYKWRHCHDDVCMKLKANWMYNLISRLYIKMNIFPTIISAEIEIIWIEELFNYCWLIPFSQYFQFSIGKIIWPFFKSFWTCFFAWI